MKTKRKNIYDTQNHGLKGQYKLAQGNGVSAQSNGNAMDLGMGINGLKGQYNLAQGKRSVALGWKTERRIVRAITFIKGLSLFGRKGTNPNSVRTEFFALIIDFTRTVFLLHHVPQAMPGARISWAFSPGINGLKGQHNLAKGKRSVALGWKAERRIVRAIKLIKEQFLFRTSEMTLCFPEMMSWNSVRKEFFALNIVFTRTVFLLHHVPQTMPEAVISWPFRPGLVYEK